MILVIMGVGYAAFQSQLKISGTSNISGSFNIQITNIETILPSESGGGILDGYNISEPTYTPSSATFSAGFEFPGSTIAYIVEVSNLGSIDGQVGIGNLSCGDNSAIMCQAMAIDEGQTNFFQFNNGNHDYSSINFSLKVGEKHYIQIIVGYADVTEQPADIDASIKLDLTYEQYVDPTIPIPSGETTLIGGQEVDIVSGGYGLYKDEYENGRYVYKGANPNNYIEFDNGEIWRIISKEADGTYKILKNELLPDQTWDSSNSNNWAKPATLNTYLNGEYYNSLDSSIKDNIVSHTWGIGAVNVDNNDLAAQIASEQGTTWSGNIGLIAFSDYLRANSDMKNCGTVNTNKENYKICRNTDWMYISGIDSWWWTISPSTDDSRLVWTVYYDGNLYHYTAYTSDYAPRPAAYLKSNITLSGSGTSLDPFKIVS